MESWTTLWLLLAVTTLPARISPHCLPPHAGRATLLTPYRLCPQLWRPTITCRPVPPPPVPAPIIVTVPPSPPHAPLRIYVRPSRPAPPMIPQIVVLPPPPAPRLPAVVWLRPLGSRPWGPCVPVSVRGTATPGVYWGTPCPTALTSPCNRGPC